MIKKVIITALAVVPLWGWAQEAFTVSGKVGTLSAPAKAYIVYTDNGNRVLDSANIEEGAFTFTGTVSEPTLANLAIDHEGVGVQQLTNPDLVNIYLEKGQIEVKSPDSLSNATLSGTNLNVDQQKLANSVKPVIEQMKALAAKYQSATEEQMNSEEFMGNLQSEYENLEKEIQLKQSDFIKEHPKSMISLFSLRDIAESTEDAAELNTLFEGLDASLQNSTLGQELHAQINTSMSVAIGAIAPDFTQADTAGNPVSLKGFRGKYVLIDFWASWCAPCRAENPNVVAAYQQYKDKGFTVLGVSLDQEDGREAWLKAIHDDKLTWTHVSDLKFWENEVAVLYGVRSIPKNYLIDPEGKIIGSDLRGEDLQKKLEEVL